MHEMIPEGHTHCTYYLYVHNSFFLEEYTKAYRSYQKVTQPMSHQAEI